MNIFTKAILASILLLPGASAMAQYSYSTFQAPYQPLSNPVDLTTNDPTWDDDEFNLEIGFPVNVMGTLYDSMLVESNGTILLHNGLNNGDLWTTVDTLPAFIGFGEFISQNGYGDLRHRTAGSSPINYEITGTPGSRIAMVEWKNAGFYNDPNNYADSISFQIWIYETSGDVEYRYGSSQVSMDSYSGQTGPTVGIAPYDADPNYMLLSGYYLTGDSTSASVGSAYGQLTGTPVNGTVFRFANLVTGVKENIYANELSVYPNPADDAVNITMNVDGVASISIADVTGRTVRTETIEGYGKVSATINTSELQPGMYMITSGNSTTRLIVK